MNKKFNFIINTLIIILIIILVAVMMNYYTNTSIVPTFIYNSGDSENENIISGDSDNQKENNTTDKIIEINESGDIYIKVDSTSGDISGDTEHEMPTNQEEINDSLVIMSSENEISSKEKGEILSELDKTLMELLEVVDRVQPVDETRLITDDSEVQK